MTDTKCDLCGDTNAMFILDGKNVCRWCHPPFPQETRDALNTLRRHGLI